MKALIRKKAGKNFSTMKVEEILTPKIGENELKIKMVSSRINPVDMDLMKGMPFLKYKKLQIGGIDGAGIIIEVGKNINNFKIGEKVFFYRKFTDIGTWAEEITINAEDCAKIPNKIDIAEAGSIALPLLTAYESLIQFNAIKGQKILIHGVAGGVGFQALQIAKKLGLYVVGTASFEDKKFLDQSDLDQLIDYKSQDFSTVLKKQEIDFVFDTLGGDTLLKSIQLQPKCIVSVRYIDPTKMHKSGIIFPSILNWILKFSMRKFNKLACKNKVQLIGQVTGPNGKLLQEAVNFIENEYISRKYNSITLQDIEKNGINEKSIGKVILF